MTKESKTPLFFIAFIFLYVLLNFIFIYISKSSYNGTVTENAYEKGISYNRVLKSNQEQEKLGWIGTLEYHSIERSKIELTFTLLDKHQKPIKNAQVNAQIMRPVTDKYDSHITLKETSPGVYQEKLELPLMGQWEIKLKAILGNNDYFLNKRIILDPYS